MIRELNKMIGSRYGSKESFLEDLIENSKKEGLKYISEDWVGDVSYYNLGDKNRKIVAAMVADVEDYKVEDIVINFPIKAKRLEDIIDKYFNYKDGKYYEKKDNTEVGNYDDLLNYIGDYGCIAKDEGLLIMAKDEVESDPFSKVDYDDEYSELELLNLYEQYYTNLIDYRNPKKENKFQLSKTTLKNIDELNMKLGDEVVDGVYKIYDKDKMLGVVNFKKNIEYYQSEEEFACQIELIEKLLELKGYTYHDWVTSYSELDLDTSRLEVFSADDERLLVGSNTFGTFDAKESYEFDEDTTVTTFKNRNIYLDYLDIEEEKERISKELRNMIGNSNVTVYTDDNCENWYIANGLEIKYIDVLYKEDDENIENLSWFLSKENEKNLIERVATYLDYETKKLNVLGLMEKLEDEDGEYIFLEDDDIKDRILSEIDFTEDLSDIITKAEELIEKEQEKLELKEAKAKEEAKKQSQIKNMMP